jgi:tellurite resistance protein TehA-like permease
MASVSYGHGVRHRPSPLAVALVLDAVAIVVFGVFLVLLAARGSAAPDETFFSDPFPAALVLAAASLAILAGVVAGVALVREPLRTREGRWAMRVAVVSALSLPVIAAIAAGIAWAVGVDDPAVIAQPLVPLWTLASLAAAVLGTTAHEPGRRGILVVPFMLGAFVLVFWLGEALVPH